MELPKQMGLRSVVQIQNDAVTPQLLTTPARPAGDPLPGARIVGFTWPGPNRYSLVYTLAGRNYFINYSANETSYAFDFVDPTANSITTRTYNKPASEPTLYSVNNTGLVTGYLTRVRGTQQITEQFVQSAASQATALPIDFGSGTAQLFLILYGNNLGGNANGTATVGGTPATLTYAGPLSPFNGVGQ